ATPSPWTELAWSAWDGLMSNKHWLEGLIANTCAERPNVPGYGEGMVRERGWAGYEHYRWQQLFGLSDQELEFFKMHGAADLEPSNVGWRAVADWAEQLRMEQAAIAACRRNLQVWTHYMNGIADWGDETFGKG